MATKKTKESAEKAETKTAADVAAEVTADTVAAETETTNQGTEKRSMEAEAEAAEDPSNGFCMYIGPSILGVIQYGTVYPGTKEEAKAQLAGVIKKYPLVEKLIVSGETLPADRIKVKTPGNYLYNVCRKLASGAEGGN